ncbi:MAG: Xaa-Pro peptidase family protein [Candidatus Methanomethylicaceae archaeon]
MNWVNYPWDKSNSLMNINRVKELMMENGINALVASSAENVFYVSEFVPFHLRYPPYGKGPVVFAMLPLDGEPYLITPHIDICVLEKAYPSWIKKHVFHLGYVDPTTVWDPYYIKGLENAEIIPNPIEAFIKVVNELKLNGKIAIEMDYLSSSIINSLSKKLPNINFVDSSKIFRELRSVKSSEELKRLRKAYEATEKGIETLLEVAREGTTEEEVANEVKISVIKAGADPIFILLGGGKRGGYNICWPSKYKLKKGDVIRLDMGVVYKGYCSDASRSIIIGKPTEKIKKILSTNIKAVENVIKAMEPGVKLGKLFEIAINTWKESGFPDYRRGTYVGHGVGINDHEYPDIRPNSEIILKPGMVMAIEVPLYDINLGGFSVEDTVVIKKDGYEYIGPYPKISRELIIS